MRIRFTNGLRSALALALICGAASAQLPEIHYLQFNEGVGTTTADLAVPGVGATPTLVGTAGWNTTNPILGLASYQGGTASNNDIRTNVLLSVTGSWTIECWLQYTSTTAGSIGYFFGDSTAGSFRAFINGAAGAGNAVLRGGFVDVVALGAAPTIGTWKHVAFVHDATAGTTTPYTNGVAGTPVNTGVITLTGTDPLGLHIGGYSSGVFPGSVDEFRFWNQARTGAQIAADMNVELFNVADDVAIQQILSPSNSQGPCESLTVAETVSVRVRNTGLNTINAGTAFTMTFTVDGGAPTIEGFNFVGNLNQGQFEDFTFASTADLSTPGVHSVQVNVAYGADLNPLNDQATKNVNNGITVPVSSYPWVENFDGFGAVNGGVAVPPGWSNDPTDAGGVATNGDWFMRSATVPSGATVTGPTADHTTGVAGAGFYAQVEDAGNFATVNLLTPCLDLSSLANPTLTFWLHSKNNTQPTGENFLSVDVITYPGAVAVLGVGGPIGHLGTAWNIQAVDLSAFIGQTVQLRFRGQSSGGGTSHDLCIDDVRVFDAMPGTGQAPQPGLATLDINNAADGNGLPVSFGGNGIHTTTVATGTNVVFTFGGAPLQAIVLFAGPANPGLASFPPVGSFDIGTTVGMFGVPDGIAIVADGTQTSYPDVFFRMTAAGQAVITAPMPAFPPGYVTTFQTVNFTGGPTVVAFSNAVSLFAM